MDTTWRRVNRNKKSKVCMELDIRLSIILKNELKWGGNEENARFNARSSPPCMKTEQASIIE